jgi:uncharacterized protein YbbC (DUF1343 family)
LPGVYFRPVYYRPYYGTYKDQQCGGVQAMITDYDAIRPVEAGTHILAAVQKLYPKQNVVLAADKDSTGSSRAQMFDKVMGDGTVRAAIAAGKSAEEINDSWKPAREKFLESRKKHLLYQ